jgi:hypothetical protein
MGDEHILSALKFKATQLTERDWGATRDFMNLIKWIWDHLDYLCLDHLDPIFFSNHNIIRWIWCLQSTYNNQMSSTYWKNMEQLYWLIQKVYGQSNQQHVAARLVGCSRGTLKMAPTKIGWWSGGLSSKIHLYSTYIWDESINAPLTTKMDVQLYNP